MRFLTLILLFVSSSFAVDITIIEFTSNIIMNQYISIFVFTTAILSPFFGALSLMAGR